MFLLAFLHGDLAFAAATAHLIEDQIPRDDPRYIWWKTIHSTEDEALTYHDDGHPRNVMGYEGW